MERDWEEGRAKIADFPTETEPRKAPGSGSALSAAGGAPSYRTSLRLRLLGNSVPLQRPGLRPQSKVVPTRGEACALPWSLVEGQERMQRPVSSLTASGGARWSGNADTAHRVPTTLGKQAHSWGSQSCGCVNGQKWA